MGFLGLEDYLILDKGSKVLKEQFEEYCDWCWGHGFGNCDVCKRRFHKYYIPLRKRELRIKNGLEKKELNNDLFNNYTTYEDYLKIYKKYKEIYNNKKNKK